MHFNNNMQCQQNKCIEINRYMEKYKAILLFQTASCKILHFYWIETHTHLCPICVILTHIRCIYNNHVLLICNLIANRRHIFAYTGKLWRGNVFYLARNVSDRADVASARPSSRRGRQDGHIHKYCSRSTLPVENNSGN